MCAESATTGSESIVAMLRKCAGPNPSEINLYKEAADEIEALSGQVAAALEAVNSGLTYRSGAPGGFEVTNPHALIMAWGILAVDQRTT